MRPTDAVPPPPYLNTQKLHNRHASLSLSSSPSRQPPFFPLLPSRTSNSLAPFSRRSSCLTPLTSRRISLDGFTSTRPRASGREQALALAREAQVPDEEHPGRGPALQAEARAVTRITHEGEEAGAGGGGESCQEELSGGVSSVGHGMFPPPCPSASVHLVPRSGGYACVWRLTFWGSGEHH